VTVSVVDIAAGSVARVLGIDPRLATIVINPVDPSSLFILLAE
jgi:hypothetical protein